MSGFKAGSTYIVKGKTKFFYIVKQTGMKSWKAMLISHVDEMSYDSAYYQGNGLSLWAELGVEQYRTYRNNVEYRKALYHILTRGEFE